jgi:L-ribulose-5-phosphate 4-epimerase
MLEKLKQEVFKANLDLVKEGLVIHTWGNVSGRDTESGLIVIKPSGIRYESMIAEDMVVMDIDGKIQEGRYKPSTDAPTHLFLYRHFAAAGGIVHTHSAYATAWAQSGRPIPAYGTTHADHFYGEVPCSRKLTDEEIKGNYEENTGKVITEVFKEMDPMSVPSVLVNGHGPFCWGNNAANAVYNAVALEEIAKIAFFTELLGGKGSIEQALLDKHYLRKHGKDAYYGQKNNNK